MRAGSTRPMPATTHTGMPGVTPHRGRRERAGNTDPAARSERRRLEEHEVAVGDRGAETRHRHVDRVDVGALQPPHQAAPLAERVDDEDVDVAAAWQRVADLLGPSEHADGCLLGYGVGELVGGRIVGDLVGRAPGLPHRIVRGEDPAPTATTADPRRDGDR